MTIIETFIQLRDDIKTWVTNNLVALNSKVDKLNNFSGDYNDLTNKPNVLDDASDSLNVTDPSGNIILKVDENGLATTNVEAKTMTLNGQSLANVVDEVETLNDLVGDTAVSTQIQNAINSQYHFSGDYNDLANKPDILDDGSDSFIIADNSGNVVLEVDENGLNTTALSVNGVNIQSTFDAKVDKVEGKRLSTEDFTTAEKNKLAGLDAALAQKSNVGHDHNDIYYTEAEIDSKLGTKSDVGHKHDDVYYTEAEIDSKLSPVTVHMGNENIHVTADDKAKWNNIGNISDDGTGALNIADPSGNIIMSVDESGLNTTDVLIKGVSIQSTIEQKADSTLASAKEYADDIKDDLLNGAGAAYDTLKELGALIDVNVDAIDALDKVAASKASSADLTAHTTNKSNPHAVTLSQLGVNASADELNKLDGVTATTSELNYMSGVTSKVQTQLNAKAELAALNDHVDDKVAHITAAERKSWNEKSEFSGDYNDLTNAPDIKEDGSGNLVIADSSGNIIFRSDANGFETTTLRAQTLVVGGTDIGATVAEHETLINNKVDKVSGKGLSSNDFTTAYKTKLDGIATGATKVTVDSALSSTSTNPVQNKVINTALSNKANVPSLDTNGVLYFK